MTLAIVLASIAAYFCIGLTIARRQLPILWADALAEHEESWKGYQSIRGGSLERLQLKHARESVQGWFLGLATLWILLLPILWVAILVGSAVDKQDPRAIAVERDELRARVAELERELGIGGHR